MASAFAVPYFVLQNNVPLAQWAAGLYGVLIPIMLIIAGVMDSKHKFGTFKSYGGVDIERTIAGKMTLEGLLIVAGLASCAVGVVSIFFVPSLVAAILGLVLGAVFLAVAYLIDRGLGEFMDREKDMS